MTTSKHTPGPWTVGGDGPWICTVGNNHDDPAIFGRRPADGKPFQFGDKSADARLIAAAPELLEALKLARSALVTSAAVIGDFEAAQSPFIRDFDALIAKAEGTTPTPESQP